MYKFEFVKAQGTGNDFVIVDPVRNDLNNVDLETLAVRVCDRNFGIGADGLILVLPSTVADYRMRIINSDGSEAEMCGNGIRCFSRYLLDRGMARAGMAVETLSGLKTVDVVLKDARVVGFTVNMGAPKLDANDIPVSGYSGSVVSRLLDVDSSPLEITCVSMGNPHCVVFVDSAANTPLEQLGPRIETHPAFPKKTNVEFAQVLGRDELAVRVWERGAGATLACGTGACASVVAGGLNSKIDRKAIVHLPGGDLLIDWRESGEVYMTGPAEEVFTGEFEYTS